MHRYLLIIIAVLLAGCQDFGAAGQKSHSSAPADTGAIDRLASALNADYDNHEQVAHAQASAQAGTTIAPIRVQHTLRVVEQGRDNLTWLWRLQAAGDSTHGTVWLYRMMLASDGKHWQLMPYRATDPALAKAELVDSAKTFKFVAAQWAALEPCAQSGEWENTKFVANANVQTCSALLPGLGKEAALLPLRLALDGDMLQVATFADSTRGADALEDARRVRWFGGWAAVNGGGPQAKATNQDWHTQRDLHLSSEGGIAPLHWRDGATSGYSIMLERTSYPERKLAVLQLNVIEDATGKTFAYAWADAQGSNIGLNLGWLQIGMQQESAPIEARKP